MDTSTVMPFIVQFGARLVRKLLFAAATYMVAHGVTSFDPNKVSDDQVGAIVEFVAGLVIAVGSAIWSDVKEWRNKKA